MNVWSCKILYNIHFNVESNKNVIELLQFSASHTSQLPDSVAQPVQSLPAKNLRKKQLEKYSDLIYLFGLVFLFTVFYIALQHKKSISFSKRSFGSSGFKRASVN